MLISESQPLPTEFTNTENIVRLLLDCSWSENVIRDTVLATWQTTQELQQSCVTDCILKDYVEVKDVNKPSSESVHNMSHMTRKRVFAIFDQVRFKPTFSATEAT